MKKKHIQLNQKMLDIVEFFKDMQGCYFVGGCVRDLCMGREPKDYDLITNQLPDAIEAYIKKKGKRVWLVGKRFGTIGVKINEEMIEITTYRKELYDFVSRKPSVVFTDDLTEDLQRRDFTINSLVCDFTGTVHDFNNGLDDLKDGVIRAVGNPKIRFKEDPLRILRAIRFACKFGFVIEPKTLEKLEHCKFELMRISKERVVDEINKILLLDPDEMARGLSMLYGQNIFQAIIPDMHLQLNFNQETPYHKHMLHVHTIQVVYALRADKTYRELNMFSDADMLKRLWTALLHDIGKPHTKSLNKKGYYNYINHDIVGAELVEPILRHYKFSNDDRLFIVDTIKNHLKDECWLRPYDNGAK
jgi:putative nucleotidyltransferase with HDIG domain